MGDQSKIEWTNATSRGREFELVVELGNRAIRCPASVAEALVGEVIETVDPQHGVAVPLPAVAGQACGHEVARHRLAASRYRDEVIQGCGWLSAVSAALGQAVLAPPSGNASHPGAGSSLPTCWSSRVVLALGRSDVRHAPATLHLVEGEPPTAITTPGQAHGSHRSAIGGAWPGVRRWPSLAAKTRGRQAVSPGGVAAETAQRMPGAAAVTPLQPISAASSVFLDADPDALSGYTLNARLRSHRTIVSRGCISNG